MAEEGLTGQERLARQRKEMKAKLGLGGPGDIFDTDDLVKDEDLVAMAAPPSKKAAADAGKGQKDAGVLISQMTGVLRSTLGHARQANSTAKRTTPSCSAAQALGQTGLRQMFSSTQMEGPSAFVANRALLCWHRSKRTREEPAEAQAQTPGLDDSNGEQRNRCPAIKAG